MKKKTKSSLRFEYFFYDPYLFYEGVEPIEGGAVRIPDFLEQEKNLLERNLSINSSADYRKKFEQGNEDAIFEYAKESRVCFQAPWFIDQIEKWRIENSRERRKKLKRLFSVYIGEQRGKTALDEIKDVIKRDQRIFYEILKCQKRFPKISLSGKRNETGIFDRVKERMEDLKMYFTRDTVELVYKEYKKAADFFTGKIKSLSITRERNGSNKGKLVKRGSDQGRFKGEMQFIQHFMKTDLDDIFRRSQELSLSLDYRCSRCQKRVIRKWERKSMD